MTFTCAQVRPHLSFSSVPRLTPPLAGAVHGPARPARPGRPDRRGPELRLRHGQGPADRARPRLHRVPAGGPAPPVLPRRVPVGRGRGVCHAHLEPVRAHLRLRVAHRRLRPAPAQASAGRARRARPGLRGLALRGRRRVPRLDLHQLGRGLRGPAVHRPRQLPGHRRGVRVGRARRRAQQQVRGGSGPARQRGAANIRGRARAALAHPGPDRRARGRQEESLQLR